MDSEAYGFLPGREPSQLWMVLQSDIECNLLSGADYAGLSTDLVRAFNNIPRPHSFALAKHLGVPDTLLHPWQNFLSHCTRAFELQGWHSKPVTSCCGLPEGDALSVYAMVQLNFAWHLYMRALCPSVRALSFVDNLAVVATDTAWLVRGLACLVEFFRLWNLVLDHAKILLLGPHLPDASSTGSSALQAGHIGLGAWWHFVLFKEAVHGSATPEIFGS